ncbi:MAG: hypothetical protein HF300_08835 [Ignavibacteria bacterium]|jgi:hypothetical protein|nr:hypothetical protein [Ignavibacteria bacterium]MCU7512653.1 hypothetical protein [Ignavibacteria bacterium]MCU7521261.1 hypothetical protein [Ignavibacteria bacterium]MCU7526002.1 hypothetical protein [Ignavibacteria bacterium]HEX2962938.1 hypothetical protein [Ignavibacteriales bacterium]
MRKQFIKSKSGLLPGIMMLLVLMVSGCENLNDPGPAEFNNSLLFNLVVNSRESQSVYIYRTAQLSEWTYGSYFWSNNWLDAFDKRFDYLFVQDAGVYLSGPNSDPVQFTVKTDSLYRNKYVGPENFKPEPMKEYILSVKANKQQFTGRTFTPGDFNILMPEEGHVFTAAGYAYDLNILWTSSPRAAGYIVKIKPLAKSSSKWDNTILYRDIKADTSFSYHYDLYLMPSLDSCKVEVYAYDKNYYAHVHGKDDCAGLSGAYGFFSSSVLKSIKIKFQKIR